MRTKDKLHRKPGQIVVDGGFTGHRNVVDMVKAGVDLIGLLADTEERRAAASTRPAINLPPNRRRAPMLLRAPTPAIRRQSKLSSSRKCHQSCHHYRNRD